MPQWFSRTVYRRLATCISTFVLCFESRFEVMDEILRALWSLADENLPIALELQEKVHIVPCHFRRHHLHVVSSTVQIGCTRQDALR